MPAAAPALRPKVLIAQRRLTRVLEDAPQLAERLNAAGMEASIVDFGAMSFDEQVIFIFCKSLRLIDWKIYEADCQQCNS